MIHIAAKAVLGPLLYAQAFRVRRAGEPHATEASTYPEVAEMTDIRLI